MLKKFCLSILALVLFTGCATLKGTKQNLKLVTDPKGVPVSFDGAYLGRTPGFFPVKRNEDGLIHYDLGPKYSRDIFLKSHYRWGESFFANFVWFFWGAPVGWALDLISGAAWEYESPEPLTLIYNGNKISEAPATVAVAPPTSNYVLLSDEVALEVEKQLRIMYPHHKIIPYQRTSDIFTSYNYDDRGPVSKTARDELYADLHTQLIAESKITREKDTVEVKGTLKDVFTGKTIENFELSIPNEDIKAFKRGKTTEYLTNIVDIIPNTFSYGFKTLSVDLEYDPSFSPGYVGSLDPSRNFFSYLSSLSFKNARHPKALQGFHPVFRFVPNFTFDYNRIKFDRKPVNDLADVSFDWYLGEAGIGPEVGLETMYGYFYFQLIPQLGVSFINGTSATQEYSIWSAGFGFEAELGYLVFVTNHINLRLYFSTTSGFEKAWESAMTYLAGYHVPVTSANDSVVGISIGYFFPESRQTVKGWFF